MKCPFTNLPCGNPIAVKVTDIDKSGEITTTHMCETCGSKFLEQAQEQAAKQQTKKKTPGDVLVQHITTLDQIFSLLVGKKPKAPCPGCGLTIKDFNDGGKFGCPTCYDHYSKEFDSLAGKLHDITEGQEIKHVGKYPKNRYKESAEDHLKTLKLKLAWAIEHEKFEEAAALKKEIEALNAQKDS